MLVVFEGLHSAGKSTQVAALVTWLRERRQPVLETSWNSSACLGTRISHLKMNNRLNPLAMVLMEAADLAFRYEDTIRAALDRGDVVVSDRYVYSTIVRAVARGVDEAFVRGCFAFAPDPDLVLYLRCSAEETLRRRVATGLPLCGHLIGQDLKPTADSRTGYLWHQHEISLLYERYLPKDKTALLCTHPPAALHGQVVARMVDLLSDGC